MKLKHLFLLAVVLVAACAVVSFVQRPAPARALDPRVDHVVLDPAVVPQAAEVEIAAKGQSVKLRREGSAWKNDTAFGLPAEVAKLTAFIGEFTTAKIQRLVTTRSERLERLALGETTVTLRDASHAVIWQLGVGRTADAGGRFIRYGSEQKAYLAHLNGWIDADPKNWTDATLLKVPATDIVAVAVTLPDGAKVAVTREKAGVAWKSTATESSTLKEAAIDSLVSDTAALRFTDTRPLDDPEFLAAKAAPARVVTLKTAAGEELTVTYYRKPEEKRPKAATPPKPVLPQSPGAVPSGPATEVTASAQPHPPEFETIPAGPVFVHIASSRADATIQAMMSKRAFQIAEWTYERLPRSMADLTVPVPPPPLPAAPTK